jgi:hypothetical protein
LLAIAIYAVLAMTGTAYLTYLFPVSVGAATGMLLLAVVVQQAAAPLSDGMLSDAEQSARSAGEDRSGAIRYLAWFGALMVAVWLLGYTFGATLFMIAFISVEVGWRPVRAISLALGTIVVLTFLAYFFSLTYPEGWLPRLLDAPWWLQ